jgi:hypothetical protein
MGKTTLTKEEDMTVKVDSHIVAAIKSYLHDNDMQAQDFAARLGVTPAAITKWCRVGSGITDQKFDALFSKIKKYLPKDRIYIDDAGSERYSSATASASQYIFEPKYVPASVPVIPLEQMAVFDNMLESTEQFARRINAESVEYRAKHSGKTGIMAVKINSDIYSPVLPSSATLFVSTAETPKQSSLCVVKTTSGDVFVGVYSSKDDKFSFTDVWNRKEIMSGNIQKARALIQWIFPVLYYEVVTF